MKLTRHFKRILPVCTLLFVLVIPSLACAEYFTIQSFRSDITVNRDSSVLVTEEIETLFQRPRHGIYRDIPFRFVDDLGNRVTTPIEVISVTDGDGRPRKYKVIRYGSDLRIRIGSPRRYVRGRQVYKITYRVDNAVLFFDDHDEIYWNVTGDAWKTVIKNASARVFVDGVKGTDSFWADCFTGRYGSREKSCTSEVTNGVGSFVVSRQLSPGEGFTIAFGWKKGVVTPPSGIKALLWRLNLRENGVFLIPVVVFGLMYFWWRQKGRDPSPPVSVSVQYNPPEVRGRVLSPAEVGTITDEKMDLRDITAAIVSLAVKGFIQIEEQEEKGLIFSKKDYYLKLVKEPDDTLPQFERDLLVALFPGGSKGRMVSEMKNSFYREIKRLRESLNNELVRLGVFNTPPYRVRRRYTLIGVVGGFIGVWASMFMFPVFGVPPFKIIISFIASALIVVVFGRFMPAKTRRGVKVYTEIRGFEEFLSRAERDRLERMADKNLFERFLPYAIALDVSDRWAEAFEGIDQEPPRWYVSPTGFRGFNPVLFNSALNSSLSDIGKAMASSPRSSGTGSGGFGGGGFSGGGFGGGGGGSW